jgi:hypothetical protein
LEELAHLLAVKSRFPLEGLVGLKVVFQLTRKNWQVCFLEKEIGTAILLSVAKTTPSNLTKPKMSLAQAI